MQQQIACGCAIRHRCAEVNGFQNKLSAAIGRPGFHAHAALGDATSFGTLAAQPVEIAQPSLIALAPRRNTFTRPFGFGGDLSIQLVQAHRFIGKNAVRPAFKFVKMPITAAQLAAMQPDNAGAQIAQKRPVMADHQQGAFMLAQHIFHPFNGG